MTDAPRNWREAKIPQWVKDAVADEIKVVKLRAALSWPAEARPQPVPFKWVEYDKLIGEPVEGFYYQPGGRALHIRKKREDEREMHGNLYWKTWLFSDDGNRWMTSVTRGNLYATYREGVLAGLWAECDAAAARLMEIRRRLDE